MARKTKYNFTDYKRSALTPFELEVDESRTIVIPVPSGETIVDLEEALGSRQRLELLCGDQFQDVWELIRGEDYTVLRGLGDDMLEHFNIGDHARPPAGGRNSSA